MAANKQKAKVSSKVVFQRTDLFNETFMKYANNETVQTKFQEFIKSKRENPLQPFGSTDERFRGDGPLGQSGVTHCHLTHNVNLIYTKSGSNPMLIQLIWVGVHDELGTGQPPNPKKQKIAAKKFGTVDPEGEVFENRR